MKRLKKRIKHLVLTNEDKILSSVEKAASTVDTTCVNNDDYPFSVWMTDPDEFSDEAYGKIAENNDDDTLFYVTVSGGKNGKGKWSNYFKALTDLLVKLEDTFESVWVIEIWNDCCDDVFYIHLGIRRDFGDNKPYLHRTAEEADEEREFDSDHLLEDRIVNVSRIQRK